jgi:hypothetical protein
MATVEDGPNARAEGSGDGSTLRLVWPQWQGAGTSSVRSLASEFPFDVARRRYAVGSAVLKTVLPPHDGPTAAVPVETGDVGLEKLDGIEAKRTVVDQLGRALEVIQRHSPARIVTLGGECSVSVAPFSELAARYGDDLAILWIDSHPDIGTPASEYPGYHAMAVAALTGHGDPEVLSLLPAIVASERVALVGLHAWTDDDYPNIAEWESAPSARVISASPVIRCSAGWPPQVALGWRSISTLTPLTVTRSCWGWGQSPAGSAAPRCAGSSPRCELPPTWSDSPSRSTSRDRSCTCSRSWTGSP